MVYLGGMLLLRSFPGLLAVASAVIGGLSARAEAQSVSVTYDLVDVWLLPDVSHPTGAPRQMTGAFEWTYQPGDFGNGSGRMLASSYPWWGTGTGYELDEVVEFDQVQITMAGNYHDRGFDLELRFAPNLDPFGGVDIDTVNSRFTIEVGISHQGHVISGRAVPRVVPPEHYGDGTAGSGGHVPTLAAVGGENRIGSSAFAIESTTLLGATPCYLLVGAAPAVVSVIGVSILVEPLGLIDFAAVASGTPGQPGAGVASFPMPIPDDASLAGLSLFTQVLALDPGGPGGVAATSDGLRFQVWGR